ncbi:inositol-tetrakisphosphate 1-kinase-like isoform X3 [Ascaphus truei]|uniref:inositol-tetrakisphosphate 1-kinase-like isoform X3 n=1 Tax=Ascaphus truei TaxID=8439 RepID=UPI003F5A24F9
MPSLQRRKRIGICLNEKKKRKINFHVFEELCRNSGYDVTDIDMAKSLSSQGPFDLIIHKLSDLLVEAAQDLASHHLTQRFQDYLDTHPCTILLDPLPALHTLLDRFQSYQLLCSLESHNKVCKTRVAHGPRSHEMSLIFNGKGLSELTPPCLLQSFVNHSATLYKVFVVGSQHFVVQRPSLRNFPLGETDQSTIFFNSHQVSKAESCSHLSQPLTCTEVLPLSDGVASQVVHGLRDALGMSLFGVDLIVDTQTGRCAVIDVNAFPGYEGVPELFPALLSHVDKLLGSKDDPTASPDHPTMGSQATDPRAEQSLNSLHGAVHSDHWPRQSGAQASYKKNITSSPYFSICTPAFSADW